MNTFPLQKVKNFDDLLDDTFKVELITIFYNQGRSKNIIKARACNLQTAAADKRSVYITSPLQIGICQPGWKNKLSILECNNGSCEFMDNTTIDNFEDTFHIKPSA